MWDPVDGGIEVQVNDKPSSVLSLGVLNAGPDKGLLMVCVETTETEEEWFERGKAEGWLIWYSICSGHKVEEQDCERCRCGSWGLRMFNGRWAEPPHG